MRTAPLKVTRIGNSRGVRLPADTLRRYGIKDMVTMEERPDGILLHPVPPPAGKLSWEDTAREMAGSGENWSEWDATVGDGIEAIPWDHQARAVAERPRPYGAARRSRQKQGKKSRAS